MITLVKPRSSTAQQIVDTISHAYNILRLQTDLSPNNEIADNTLVELERYVLQPHDPEAVKEALEILREQGIAQALPKLVRQAEYELELYYTPPSRILSFPYLCQYLRLSLAESELVGMKSTSKIAFIGGGPLPWTAVSLAVIQAAKDTNRFDQLTALINDCNCRDAATIMRNEYWRGWNSPFKTIALEREPEAVEKAKAAVKILGFENHVDVQLGDGKDIVLSEDCDVVFVASMVTNKAEVLNHLFNTIPSGKQISLIIRTVNSKTLRCLLDESTDDVINEIEQEVPGLQRIGDFSPESKYHHLINSVCAYTYLRP